MTPIRVIIGPMTLALQYVRHRRLRPDAYVIVDNHAALHHLDPYYITEIIVLGLRRLTRRVRTLIEFELASITRLWNLPVLTAPVRARARVVCRQAS